MLTITIPETEVWDESVGFIQIKSQKLKLEHSLVSISKWESKWHKAFLTTDEKTEDEIMDYVKDMTITQGVDDNVYKCLTSENVKEINDYISNPMSATVISNNQSRGSRETITSELIYYWMIASNIPVEFQKWHLNRLITLIQVCSIKNQPPKKRSQREIMSRNASLNAARRKQLNSKG